MIRLLPPPVEIVARVTLWALNLRWPLDVPEVRK